MYRTKMTKIAAFLTGVALSGAAAADIGVFATSGKTMADHTFIEQGGQKAENIKKTLANIKMPAGFKIDLYAIVPDARDMAMAPQGTVLFVLEPVKIKSGWYRIGIAMVLQTK